jgi:isopentenyl diphosphate isomerase/L-lactate dehydrogenase-like FMN-dependent dehydrogenase
METEHEHLREGSSQYYARRQFLRFLLFSPLLASTGIISLDLSKTFSSEMPPITGSGNATNVFQFEDAARTKLTPEVFHFIADGADDMKTVRANREAFDQLQIRARRLVDVSKVDTTVNVLGHVMETPVILAPIGAQQQVHPEGELASARAAASRKHVFMVSTFSNFSINEIAETGKGPVWFQLYTGPERTMTKQLLQRAEAAGADVVALSVDSAVRGNRESEIAFPLGRQEGIRPRLGNFEGLEGRMQIGGSSLTLDYIGWLKANTKMKVIIKGIVTHEDARLCVEHGADGLIVSNHGGRQEESNRGTIECLPEVIKAVEGRIPVLIDGGFRRGTDIFKALALGAKAICIGRPYIWGLASFGEDGVKKVLDLLRAELVRIMQLSGTPSIRDISPAHVKRREC